LITVVMNRNATASSSAETSASVVNESSSTLVKMCGGQHSFFPPNAPPAAPAAAAHRCPAMDVSSWAPKCGRATKSIAYCKLFKGVFGCGLEGMLQVFYFNVAKVDLDNAMLQTFKTHVASV
jgi:hypothetical protein